MRKEIVEEKKGCETKPLSSTIGSMRARSTSDEEKRGERRSNEPIDINTIGSMRARSTSDEEKRGERRSNEPININTIGSMRARSTSDEEKRGERRSNEPIGGSPQDEDMRTKIEWTSL